MSGSFSRKNLIATVLRGGHSPIRPPWALSDSDFTEICTGCGDCIPACPRKILVKGRAGYPVIDFALGGCDFCGACANACPEPSLFYSQAYAVFFMALILGFYPLMIIFRMKPVAAMREA